jgi:hypothetical protein
MQTSPYRVKKFATSFIVMGKTGLKNEEFGTAGSSVEVERL